MGLRRKSREMALQFLFSHDFTGASDDTDALSLEMERFCDCFDTGKKALPYARELIQGICANREMIDRELAGRSHNWRLERMSHVDRNILRIAVFEMKLCQDVPTKVAINEALEIAKLYSIPDSVAFINGILDAVQGGETIPASAEELSAGHNFQPGPEQPASASDPGSGEDERRQGPEGDINPSPKDRQQ